MGGLRPAPAGTGENQTCAGKGTRKEPGNEPEKIQEMSLEKNLKMNLEKNLKMSLEKNLKMSLEKNLKMSLEKNL